MNEILKKQQELQALLATDHEDEIEYVGQLCDQIRNMSYFLNQEVTELMEAIAGSRDINKPWKTSYPSVYCTEIDITDEVKSEAMDVFKFALNICLLAGITPDNVEEEFNKVHQKCLDRYHNGY